MKKIVIIGTASVIPEDVKVMCVNKHREELHIHLEIKDEKHNLDKTMVIVEGVTLEEATEILNNYFEKQQDHNVDSFRYLIEGLNKVSAKPLFQPGIKIKPQVDDDNLFEEE
jgi:hypothetical protein